MGDWTFFSNHGHVFFCLARNGDARLRDVAADVGITERAVQKIVRDLEQAGYIEVRKQGRCNRYRINRRKSLRHPLESHCSVSKLVKLVAPGARTAALAEAEPLEPVTDRETRAPVRAETTPEPAATPEPALRVPQAELEKAAPAPPPEATPRPVAAALAADEETGAAAAPSGPTRKPEGEEKGKGKGKRKKDKAGSEPVDVRQQGSLF